MKVRTCKGNALITGASACPYDREKIVMAIVVAQGQKLPADLSGDILEELCHADRPARIMPIATFVEYAKSGGEPNVSAVGYGPNQVSDVSALTDTFTMGTYNDVLAQSLSRTMNTLYDVYFVDKNNVIYGLDDGTDILAGFPMASIYPTITQFPTSGAKSTLLVNFCYQDARKAFENTNYEQLDFNVASFVYGLVPVKFLSVDTNKFKIVEAIGGLDRTSEFGEIIAKTPTAVIKGSATGVTYDSDTETLTISSTTTPTLKTPAELYTAGVKGIEQAE